MDEITVVETIETDGSMESLLAGVAELEAKGFTRMPGLVPVDRLKLPLYRIHGDSQGHWFGDCKRDPYRSPAD